MSTERDPIRSALAATWAALLLAFAWIGVLIWIGSGTPLGALIGIAAGAGFFRATHLTAHAIPRRR